MTKAFASLSGDFRHRSNVLIVVGCILLATGIFIVDIASLPLGVAAGVAYVPVVLISLRLPRWQYSISVAAGVSVLTILGYFLSEPAGIPWMVVVNRLLALVAIWLTAITGSWIIHSRRKSSEDALRMQKCFSDTLFETAPAVVLLIDPNGRITGINPQLQQVSGYSAEEVLGRHWIEAFSPDDGQAKSKEGWYQMPGNALDAGATLAIVTKNGKRRQIEWRGTTLSDAVGNVVGYLNVGHDVTERIERETALQEAIQEADRARHARSRFLETASDDLRQSLQTLSLLNGTLRKIVTLPKAQEIFVMQGDALANITDLLNCILQLNQLESGDVELKITEIPVREIFEQVRNEFEVQAQAKGLQINFHAQTEAAYSDRILLTGIIRILVSNAVRYTSQGFINVYCRRMLNNLKIAVEDTGIGIAPDQMQRIFDEFYRIENEPGHRIGGLGLGLSIVERSVNILGTCVKVESEPGRGSSFSLVVPAASRGRISAGELVHNDSD